MDYIYTNMAHTHDMFSTKQRSAWAQWCCVWTKPAFVRTQLCFVRTVYARREAEICARTFWLREDEAELCPIEHFRKDTALLRPAHMTAAFSSLRVLDKSSNRRASGTSKVNYSWLICWRLKFSNAFFFKLAKNCFHLLSNFTSPTISSH